jgi:ribosome biogenesis GTPase A
MGTFSLAMKKARVAEANAATLQQSRLETIWAALDDIPQDASFHDVVTQVIDVFREQKITADELEQLVHQTPRPPAWWKLKIARQSSRKPGLLDVLHHEGASR